MHLDKKNLNILKFENYLYITEFFKRFATNISCVQCSFNIQNPEIFCQLQEHEYVHFIILSHMHNIIQCKIFCKNVEYIK